MLNMIVTNAVVSKGYDGNPPIRYYTGENGFQTASFRIGKRVYDSKAQDKHRWLNFNVKVYGEACERIKRMKLKEGSFINLVARYDEESWEDKKTKETRTAPLLILQEIEYSSTGGDKSKNDQSGDNAAANSTPPNQAAAPQGAGQGYPSESQGQQYSSAPGPNSSVPQGQGPLPMPGNFTGFEGFGGQNPYF